MTYDLGDGPKRIEVGVRAQVGWELRTKRKMSSIADGFGVTDMVGLLMEQLKVDDLLPDGVVNEAGLARHIVDLDMVDIEAEQEAAREQGQNGITPWEPSPVEA